MVVFRLIAFTILATVSLNAIAFTVKSGEFKVFKDNEFENSVQSQQAFDAAVAGEDLKRLPVKTNYRLQQKGKVITLLDRQNDLTYTLDLAAQREQELPEGYLRLQAQNKNVPKSLIKLIDRITVSNLKETDDRVFADINFYLKYQSIFANADLVIALSVELSQEDCPLIISNEDFSDSKEIDSKCVHARIGDEIAVKKLIAGIAGVEKKSMKAFSNTAAFILDLNLKLFGFITQNTYSLLRIPKGL